MRQLRGCAIGVLVLASCAPGGPAKPNNRETAGPSTLVDSASPEPTDEPTDQPTDEPTTDSTATTDTGGTTRETGAPPDTGLPGCGGPAPRVLRFEAARRPGQIHSLDFEVSLSASAAVALACTADDDAAEALLLEAPASAEHRLSITGFLPDTAYTCRIVPTCPRAAGGAALNVRTARPGPEIPAVEVRRPDPIESTGAPFVLLGHDRHCPGDSARLLLFDTDGGLRWSYEAVPDIDIAYESQYLGGGRFTWGGGYYDGYPPEEIDLDHQVLGVAPVPPGSTGLFHHDGRMLPSGLWMTMLIQPNTFGPAVWDGFGIALADPSTGATTWFYDSQRAVASGHLPADVGTYGDPWHANWADYQVDPVYGDRLYVSLCHLGQILAVDAETREALWVFGPGGEFSLTDPSGGPVDPGEEWPQCQHGLEFERAADGDGGVLLVYDNGAHGRGYSRLTQYTLRESTRTATLDWAWTERRWMEPSWGDIDRLPGGHVLATMGHACWSPTAGDVSSVVEVDPLTGEVPWRLDFQSTGDAIYRAERVDVCDRMPLARFCPDTAAALEALQPLLDPCSVGLDADEDGDGAFRCADADCDDLDPARAPGLSEACDGVDNDCDEEIDQGLSRAPFFADADGDGYGAGPTVEACAAPPGFAPLDGDCDDASSDLAPGLPDTCDGLDNDCDGTADPDLACWSCRDGDGATSCAVATTYAHAEAICTANARTLVIIPDEDTNLAVARLAGGPAWIGLNDRDREGQFRWVDGSVPTFTRWYPGEPNDWGGVEDCASTNFGEEGNWNDDNCEVSLPFVCSR